MWWFMFMFTITYHQMLLLLLIALVECLNSTQIGMQYRERGSNRQDKNRFLFKHTGSGKHLYGFWLHEKSCMFADGETRFQFSLKMLIPIVLGFHTHPLIPSSFLSHLNKHTSSQYSLHLKLKSMQRVRKISWPLNSTFSKHPINHLLS